MTALSTWQEATQIGVSTRGRGTGDWHEKWWIVFGIEGERIYLLEEIGERADWVQNIQLDSRVLVRLEGGAPLQARARVLTGAEEVATAREVVGASRMGQTVRDLITWGLPVVIEVGLAVP